jgi:hypothetical protein
LSLTFPARFIQKIQAVLVHLLPAYKKSVPNDTLVKLSEDVSAIVPPLSEEDSINLYIRLPILGAALASLRSYPDGDIYEDAMETDQTSLQEICIAMLPGLTEYVLAKDYDAKARSAAASCIYAILSLGNLVATDCPVKPLVKDIINRSLSSAAGHISVLDCLNLMSLMVSSWMQFSASSCIIRLGKLTISIAMIRDRQRRVVAHHQVTQLEKLPNS